MRRKLGTLVLTGLLACGSSSPESGVRDDAGSDATFHASGDATGPETSAADAAAPDVSIDAPAEAAIDAAPPPAARLAYVGAADGNIYVYAFDPQTAALNLDAAYPAGDFPSFLAFDLPHHHLLATNESTGSVALLDIDPSSGALALRSTVNTGAGPTFVGTDGAGKFAFVADYTAGSAEVFPIGAQGTLGAATAMVSPGALCHSFVLDPSERFAFVTAKGDDLIAQYTFNSSSGTLAPNPAGASVSTAAGAGPRHLAFHPSLPLAYVINENDSTLVLYSFNAGNGTLSEAQTLTTIPSGFTGTNTGAEILVAPSGKFVYASDRGSDTIASFSLDPQTGRMTPLDHTPTGGKTPRHFSLDPTGQVMLVANQESNDVVSFRVDTGTGKLTQLGTTVLPSPPFYVRAVALP